MSYAKPSVAFLFAYLFLPSSFPSRAELPPLFTGELNVCNRVEQERAKGRSLEEALRNVILAIQPEESMSLGSIQRAIIDRAIRLCRYDPSAVAVAAYRAGVPLPLIVGAAEATGADRGVITAALVQAGAAPSEVREAFVRAEAPQDSSVQLFLPPVFEVGNGLGQSSPFRP
ncbi:MAG: hypothetical protein HY349_06960 [Nitrospirae bacterium]|nr:hypothetical protein [Nitrospirota bacterium]